MLRSSRRMLVAAAGLVAAAAAVWYAAFATATGERLDGRALAHATAHDGPRVRELAGFVSQLADPLPFAALSAAIVAIALARRRPGLGVTVAVVLLGATISAEVLKQLTADPREVPGVPWAQVSAAAWPSGHTTAATALGLCLVAVAPVALRPVVAALGAAFALGVGGSVVLLARHFPSDVAGALCLASAWTLAGLAVLVAAERRVGAPHGSP